MDIARSLAALDELPEATVVISAVRDDAGTIVDFVFDYANRVAGRVARVTSVEQLVGRRVLETLPAFPRELFVSFVEVVETGATLRTRIELGPRNTCFAVSASRLRDGLLVVYEDVSARERVRATERRYGAVLEATSDWVSIADGDNNIVYVNPAGRRMVGIGLDEDVTGRTVGAFSPAWARERVLREGLAAARRDGVWRADLARLHRDGHEIPVSQVIVAHLAADGAVDFYATIARDMTGERAAEAALRASEERFRVTFEQAPIGVSLIDLDGRFLQVNDAYCRTVGRSREELLELGPVAITHPDDIAHTRHAFRVLADGTAPTVRFEKRYVDARGDSVWVELSGSVLRDDDGRPQYFMGMVQDLGERRVAHTLQRSMLTKQLPAVDGVELAVRYLPGVRQTEISGDWYDVIPLPDGRVGVVIGDVVGRGIEAAATMSQLRTALRAYAIEGLEPAEVVAKLHRLVDHLGVGLSTTLAYLDFDPFTREVRYVSAGHLPVLHMPAEGPSRFLPGARSTPLGAVPVGAAIPQERIVLGAGDGVLLYTDGLVERRDDGIDSRLQQLRAAVAGAPADLNRALEHLTATLVGDETLRQDDVALLALRVMQPVAETFAAVIGPYADELAALRRGLRDWLTRAGATARESGDVLIAVGEACANAIEHAGAQPGSTIDVRAQLVGREVVLRICDRGHWRASTPRSDRGHGLRLMRVLMDTIDIAAVHEGTRVELRRRLAARGRAGHDGADGPVEAGANGGHAAGASVALDRDREVTVARLQGEVDIAAADRLGRALTHATRAGDRGLVLDLNGVDYLDSAGLHLLHDTSRTLAARGQSLRVVVAPDAEVARVLEIVDLAQTVAVDASVAEAVDALTSPPLL
ncbi:MAG: anti-sigma factor antagonist [Solirubrobacteraceae bacterium]|nr:anti-sigma factor antagonist [Solirubrobacteraceae bacterium]